MLSLFVAVLFLCIRPSSAQNTSSTNSTVSIPHEYTYLLPDGFTGNVNYTFVNSTSTSNSTINNLLHSASQAPFIAYDQSFLDILGPNPQASLIQDRTDSNDLFAYEAGVWVPERHEVWFTSDVAQGMQRPSMIYALNLSTNAIYPLNGTSQNITDPNGGYYFEGKVYFATYPSNTTYRGGIVSIDVQTLEVETVVNSYFGLPFNGVDDIAWAVQGNDKYMFFTDLEFAFLAYPNLPTPSLPAGVWRWDPQTETLLQVVGRNEVNPNGVRVSPDMRYL